MQKICALVIATVIATLAISMVARVCFVFGLFSGGNSNLLRKKRDYGSLGTM